MSGIVLLDLLEGHGHRHVLSHERLLHREMIRVVENHHVVDGSVVGEECNRNYPGAWRNKRLQTKVPKRPQKNTVSENQEPIKKIFKNLQKSTSYLICLMLSLRDTKYQ